MGHPLSCSFVWMTPIQNPSQCFTPREDALAPAHPVIACVLGSGQLSS